MSVNLLAVNVGNTRTQFAAFVDNRMHDVHRVAHGEAAHRRAELREALATLTDARDAAIYIASVNDAKADAVAGELRTLTGLPVRWMEDDVTVPIGRQLDRETIIGVDRLLNAAAAFDQLQQACIIIDAGTAVTVDFVDGAGTFHGGAILPGAQIMLDAMHAHTAQLPELKFRRPDEPIGHSTGQAMLTGAFHGLRGAVRELTEAFAVEYGAYPKVIATGGDAETLFADYELVEARVPHLTLQGIAVAHRIAGEQDGARE